MTSIDDLRAIFFELKDLGISVRVVDGNLHFRPKDRLTPELAARLREHKTDVVPVARLLALDDDQYEAWQERVAIQTVEGGLSQDEAEKVAWQQLEQPRQAKPPTVLKHCRCQDCHRLRDGGCAVGVLVPGAYPLNQWHYCVAYLGPAISPHTVVFTYDDVPAAQQATLNPET